VLHNSASEVKATKLPLLFCNGYLNVTASTPSLDLQRKTASHRGAKRLRVSRPFKRRKVLDIKEA
jgi:hypothetical protein